MIRLVVERNIGFRIFSWKALCEQPPYRDLGNLHWTPWRWVIESTLPATLPPWGYVAEEAS